VSSAPGAEASVSQADLDTWLSEEEEEEGGGGRVEEEEVEEEGGQEEEEEGLFKANAVHGEEEKEEDA